MTTLNAFVGWLEAAPPSTTMTARDLLEVLAPLAAHETPQANGPVAAQEPAGTTWRERLWLVPAETRLGVREAAEAIGRPRSWVYRHTCEKGAGDDRLPHRKLSGELQFTVGELRAWLSAHEEIVVAGRPAPASLILRRA